MTSSPETTYRVWICRTCRKACKVQPQVFEPGCRCKNPVMPLRPTRETQMYAPKPRPMHALSDEEARLRALGRKGTRVRVTFEAEVADAWQWSSGNTRGLSFIVTTPDGRRHPVDPDLPGVRIEVIADDEPTA